MSKIIPFVKRARRRQAQRRSFWAETPEGHMVHISGDPQMDPKTLAALTEMMDLAVKQFSKAKPEQDQKDEAPAVEVEA